MRSNIERLLSRFSRKRTEINLRIQHSTKATSCTARITNDNNISISISRIIAASSREMTSFKSRGFVCLCRIVWDLYVYSKHLWILTKHCLISVSLCCAIWMRFNTAIEWIRRHEALSIDSRTTLTDKSIRKLFAALCCLRLLNRANGLLLDNKL